MDPQVSFFKKAVILGALGYLVLPVDLLPDPVLGFGFIDDVFILLFAFIRLLDQLEEYVEHQEPSKDVSFDDDSVIDDVEYEVYDNEGDEDEL